LAVVVMEVEVVLVVEEAAVEVDVDMSPRDNRTTVEC